MYACIYYVYADIHIMLECDKCTGTMYYINIDILKRKSLAFNEQVSRGMKTVYTKMYLYATRVSL